MISPGSTIATGTRSSTASRSPYWSASGCRAWRAKGAILDVCCGTGYLAGLLTARGYRVTGIDASPEMIAHARENVPDAAFQVADASAFRVLGKFDGAVSTFDSLNHILSEEALQAAFQRTAAALKPGAPFAFDMLLESAYQTDWSDAFSLVRDDHVLLLSGSGFDFRTRHGAVPRHHVPPAGRRMAAQRRGGARTLLHHQGNRRRVEPCGLRSTPPATMPATWE